VVVCVSVCVFCGWCVMYVCVCVVFEVYVIFFYFLVSFDEAVETVMQMCTVQQPT